MSGVGARPGRGSSCCPRVPGGVVEAERGAGGNEFPGPLGFELFRLGRRFEICQLGDVLEARLPAVTSRPRSVAARLEPLEPFEQCGHARKA